MTQMSSLYMVRNFKEIESMKEKQFFFVSIKRFGTLENSHKNDDEGKEKLNEMLDFGSFVIGNIISLQHMLVQKSWHPTFVVLDL